MSASPFHEPLDAPMHDFAEFDVPMNSAPHDFFLELSMDHDGHNTTYTNQEGVEVDMETYDVGNVEYEMADETEGFNGDHYHHEPFDVEVYDASDVHSLQPSPRPQLLPSLTPNPEMSLLSSPVPFSEAFIPQPSSTPVEQSIADRPIENDSSVAEHPKPSPQQEDTPLAQTLEPRELNHTDTTGLVEEDLNAPPTVNSHDAEEPAPLASGTIDEAGSSTEPTEAGSAPQPQVEEQSEILQSLDIPSENSAQAHGENHTEFHSDEADNTDDPHEISEGVYIDPPPAVFVSVGSSEVAEHCLFNQPTTDRGSRSPPPKATGDSREVYPLLLQNRPTLYYEPLNCVFEALRQDDIITEIPEALEGELVIDAYDLQLAISEDNIYAHEISLHDLNMLHDGSDFAGPLRIRLRSAVPRFILRYRLLQEQISRLDLAAGAAEEEDHDRAERHDNGHQPDHHDRESQYDASARDDQKDVDESEGAHEPEVQPDQTKDEQTVSTDSSVDVSSIPQAFEDTICQPVSGEASQALEDEGDYEDTNVDTDHADVGNGDLDAPAVHEAVDTDAATPISNQNLQFGGEQTEHLDYVQPEEYDEGYTEYFPEESGYDLTVGYGENEEQDTSTSVYESKQILPGSDLDEADTPALSTPLVDPTPAQRLAIADNHLDPLVSHEPLETTNSHHTDKALIVDKQTDQHKTILQLPTDESDSNFLAMLEREADSELDHPLSNSNTKHIEKSGIGGSSSALDEVWDEWDDELDADGEADEEWLDPGDAVSNESSVTLSSSSSGKRGHEEVEPEEGGLEASISQSSPGKRPRIH